MLAAPGLFALPQAARSAAAPATANPTPAARSFVLLADRITIGSSKARNFRPRADRKRAVWPRQITVLDDLYTIGRVSDIQVVRPLWPEFIYHDAVSNQYIDRVEAHFGQYDVI
jgi:hypothetical protein